MNLEEWTRQGSYVTVHERRMFFVDTGGEDLPTLVILHGYPTSSHDYHGVLPTLAKHYRVIVHDHIGFGLSEKPRDYSYSLIEQADQAIMLWRQMGVTSARVFAHDYGTSVATELLARWNRGLRPIELESMTLCNGSVHIELAKLRVVQKLLLNKRLGPVTARMTNRKIFDLNMRRLWHDRSTLTDADLEIVWQLLVHDGGKAVIPQITHYLDDRFKFWHRWTGALQSTTLPLSFVWGTEDPIVGGDVAKLHHREAPGSTLRLLEGVGHYPMIEAPERWLEAMLDVLQT